MNIQEIVTEEIGYWLEKMKAAPDNEKYHVHGAVCCLRLFEKGVTLERLRVEFKRKAEREKTAEFKQMKWDIAARCRAGYAKKAIKKLGMRIKELDNDAV
jgi:hypothetical protein